MTNPHLQKNLCAPPVVDLNSHVHLDFLTDSDKNLFINLNQCNKKFLNFFEISDITQLFHNTQSQKKGRNMAMNSFVKKILVAIKNEIIYIKAECGAEMTVGKIYNIRLIIVDGDNDAINFSDCNCVAGCGPIATCKHISAILNCIESYARNGKSYKY